MAFGKSWKDALVQRGDDPSAVQRSVRGLVLSEFDSEAKAAAESETEERIILPYVISDNTVDRHGDTVDVDGWDLQHYRQVVLWSHQSDIAPVAKALRTYKYNQQLRSVAAFTTAEENAFGASIGRLAKAGFIPQASVGFLGLEGSMSEDKDRQERYWHPIDYSKQELMEWSPVNIGSNRSAVVLGLQSEAVSDKKGIMKLVDWALQQKNVPEELVKFCTEFYASDIFYSMPSDNAEKISVPAIETAIPSIERAQVVDLGKYAQEILNGG